MEKEKPLSKTRIYKRSKKRLLNILKTIVWTYRKNSKQEKEDKRRMFNDIFQYVNSF